MNAIKPVKNWDSFHVLYETHMKTKFFILLLIHLPIVHTSSTYTFVGHGDCFDASGNKYDVLEPNDGNKSFQQCSDLCDLYAQNECYGFRMPMTNPPARCLLHVENGVTHDPAGNIIVSWANGVGTGPFGTPENDPSKIASDDRCFKREIQADPISSPSAVPSSLHGDPIVWTVYSVCYDLYKPGNHLLSSHPLYPMETYIAVYNNFIREIQIVNKFTNEIALSINNFGEVIKENGWNEKWYYEEELLGCPSDMVKKNECPLFYTQYRFDVQDIQIVARVHNHNYEDPALFNGNIGTHFDFDIVLYPAALDRLKNYEGVMIKNPWPNDPKTKCPEF